MRTGLRLYMVACAAFLALPVLVVCAASLNGGRSMFFPPRDPTLARFGAFFREEVWVRALQNSVLIATASAALAVLIAWPIAYRLWRDGSPLTRFLAGAGSLPFVLPPIVFGVGLGFMWGFAGALGKVWSGIVSHAVLHAAVPLTTISVGLAAIDRAHLDAAATMGATERQALTSIVVPQTLPYTLSGFFFAFVLSFNEFIVVFFVASSSYATVTLQIFNSLRNGFTPTMAVAAVLFIVVSVVVFGLIGRFNDLPRLLGADRSR